MASRHLHDEQLCPEKPRPHAVVLPYPAQGHLNPVMQLAKQLALRGFVVTFVITTEFRSRIQEAHNSTSPAPPIGTTSPLDIRFAQISDGLPPDFDRFGGNLTVLSQAVEAMAGPFEQLIRQLMQDYPPVTCIFSDMFAPFTQDVANAFHIPRVAVWLQSAASYSVNFHVPLLIRQGHMPVKVKSKDLITCIPGHPPLAPWELPSFYQVQDLSNFMVQFKLKPFLRVKEAAFVLINTFYDLESEILDILQQDHPAVLAAGPFLPPAFLGTQSDDTRAGVGLWAEDNECLGWLDKQAPSSVLYVAFGSIVSMDSAKFWELAMGLEACHVPLLWVIRPDFVKSDVASIMPTSLLERNKQERIYITSWAPQAMVLSHPSVGAFLTHCGWNSTLEGVSMGVPMLGWPLFSEQWLNRKWVVEEWKIGMKFEEGEDGIVTREEVERVIREMMQGPEGKIMRERALRLKEASRRAWSEEGSSFNNLDMVIRRLESSHTV